MKFFKKLISLINIVFWFKFAAINIDKNISNKKEYLKNLNSGNGII